MNRILKLSLVVLTITFVVIIVSFGSFYTYWNTASPDRTCASCHEIGKSVHSMAESAHRQLQCKECHGTALSNGIHSMKEKGMMIVSHVKEDRVENIRMSELQLLDVMDNCKRCHSSEFARWASSGHSMQYQHVFLNEKHNTTEQINFGCLRWHGMFFEGNVADVVEPLNIKGPWKMKNEELAARTAIPCMACHQIHQDGMPGNTPNYSDPKTISFQRIISKTKLAFYDRHEKVHFPVSALPKLNLKEGERMVNVSEDVNMRNCVQCHAPNAHHQAGTSDDRTPRGVHEGISCNACHEPHSNNPRNSCVKCHPALSNCKLEVTTMNTSFADPNSPNNIHFVSCTDCHKDDTRIKNHKSQLKNKAAHAGI